MASPRILFVLGKGGVGRSTVATSLALAATRRGERVLVFEWTLSDPIAPWFGLRPAGSAPVEVAPNLFVATYALEESLRAYFVEHLHWARFYRVVIRSERVRALLDAAPGIPELLFLGTLWWLTTLAPSEAGPAYAFDRVIVDTPATGHGASILDLPSTLAQMRAAGMLAREIERVTTMMRDPAWTGAAVVTTAEELAIEESRELVPRITSVLDRPPIALFLNRAIAGTGFAAVDCGAIAAGRSSATQATLATLLEELEARALGEARLLDLFAGKTERGILPLEDLRFTRGEIYPAAIVLALEKATVPCL